VSTVRDKTSVTMRHYGRSIGTESVTLDDLECPNLHFTKCNLYVFELTAWKSVKTRLLTAASTQSSPGTLVSDDIRSVCANVAGIS